MLRVKKKKGILLDINTFKKKYTIKKITNNIKNQLNKSKQKNTKNITFKQVLKNSDFYSCEL